MQMSKEDFVKRVILETQLKKQERQNSLEKRKEVQRVVNSYFCDKTIGAGFRKHDKYKNRVNF